MAKNRAFATITGVSTAAMAGEVIVGASYAVAGDVTATGEVSASITVAQAAADVKKAVATTIQARINEDHKLPNVPVTFI